MRVIRVSRFIFAAALALTGLAVVSAPAGAAAKAKATIVVGAEINEQMSPGGAADLDQVHVIGAWVKYVNGKGGIDGHPVKVIIKNDADDPGTAASNVQALISDGVVAILDQDSLNSDWASTVEAAKIPVISLNESASGFTYETNPDFFGDGTTVYGILWGHVAMAALLKHKTVFGGIYCTELSQCAQAVEIWKIYGPKVGETIALTLGASETAPDYTAECLAMQQAGVDALFSAGPPSNRVADDCARQNYHPLYIGSEGTIDADMVTDPNLNGALQNQQGFPWMLDSTPALKLFHSVEGKALAEAESPAAISAGWTGLQLLTAALKNGVSATPTAANVLAGLYALNGTTLGGLSASHITFTPGKPSSQLCYFIVGIKNKKWIAPYGLKTQCRPVADAL
jgi:branched-chain amino acid transport system substrate-binding protein